jgi:hydrogenase maturation protease
MPDNSGHALIVCVGNELIADDAAGFEVYQRLAGVEARVEYLSVGGIDILPLLDGTPFLVVVDAVHFGYPPGTLHCVDWADLPRNSAAISAHSVGLREALEIGTLLYPDLMPAQITLVGIEGRCFDLPRRFMTPEVSDAIEPAVLVVKGLVGGNR